MSDGDRKAEGAPDAPQEQHWLDKLRNAIGLKGGSIREDLAVALATEDVAAGFSPEERAMMSNILHLRDVRVDDIMIPRADIEAVDIDITLGDLFARFRNSGHSRMPVFRESLDDPVGLVHIKDLMGYITEQAAMEGESGKFDLSRLDLNKKLSETQLVRNILFVPPSMPVAVLLPNMQASRMQMALVIDEYGGTDGLVSLEDAVEMIVGEIEDESDEDAGPMIVSDGKGGFLADARADIDEVSAAIGEDLATGEDGEDVDTIGGLVFNLIGRIPVRGELIAGPNGYEIEVLDADPRRLKRLRIYRRAPEQRRRRPTPEGAPPPAGAGVP
ncbi:MAG TPA: hemolysin family protein [Bauldia sp.]|nr:hemolysin family protein [Bauldia sp.]